MRGLRRQPWQLLESDASNKIVKRIPAYSHNDEMQGDEALETLALSLGFGAIEVDTWLAPIPRASIEEKKPVGACLGLLIGHDVKDLDPKRSLQKVYLDPLMRILDAHNPNGVHDGKWVGVYEHDPTAEVLLLIDNKTDGIEMWPYLVQALQPLLARGYLTTYDTGTATWSPAPLRIVGTGGIPLPYIYHQPSRFIFHDAPLLSIAEQVIIPETPAGPAVKITIDPTIAPIASAQFPPWWHVGAVLPDWKPFNPVLSRMEEYTRQATIRGVKARWWGTAPGPRPLRRRVWALCWMTGSGWLNADALEDAARWISKHGH